MELIVDANILISALLKNGVTRKLLLSDEFRLYTPKFILEEFFEHINELAIKSNISDKALNTLIKNMIVESKIKIISKDEVKSYIQMAEQISTDPDDVQYFATALKLKCGIWSNDKKMKNQSAVKIYTTSDLLEIFNNRIVFYKTTTKRER
jgi:predicted nucleic acid-binding protein